MKKTFLITLYICFCITFLIGLFQIKYILPESYVKGYYLDNSTSTSTGVYPVIRVVLENGEDYNIYLPNKSFDETVKLINDLNKHKN